MKLRCEHNSLRLRLRKTEVEALHQQATVAEEIHFPGQATLRYALSHHPHQAEVMVSFEEGRLTINLPSALALAWITTAQVGISAKVPLPQGGDLDLLIEKDFPCVTRPGENPIDFFADLAQEQTPQTRC